MTPLHRLEHMLDAMGIDATGLERAPEYERAEGENCYKDDAGVLYYLNGLILDIVEPEKPHAAEKAAESPAPEAEKPEDIPPQLTEEMLGDADTETLKKIIAEEKDPKLQCFAFAVMKERGEDISDVVSFIYAIVLPRIEDARTTDGYDEKKICAIWYFLQPAAAAHYGFQLEYHENETQDGELWITERIIFDGHRYTIYDSQRDDGYCS